MDSGWKSASEVLQFFALVWIWACHAYATLFDSKLKPHIVRAYFRVQLPGIFKIVEVTPLFGGLIKMLRFILQLSDEDAQTWQLTIQKKGVTSLGSFYLCRCRDCTITFDQIFQSLCLWIFRKFMQRLLITPSRFSTRVLEVRFFSTVFLVFCVRH